MNNNTKYAVCTIINDSYVEPFRVMISSFIDNNDWFNGDIIIIYVDDRDKGDDLSLSLFNRDKLKKEFPLIKYKNINNKEYELAYEHMKPLTYSNLYAAFYKIEVFGLKEYDKILYLDSDTLIIDSLKELFDINKDGFFCCKDLPLGSNYDLEKENIIQWNGEYLNSGVFLVGKKYLGTNVKEDIIRFSELFNPNSCKVCGSWKGKLADQDIINEYFFNKSDVYNLPIIYNTGQRKFINNNRKISNEKIIHFLGAEKPWVMTNDKRWEYIFGLWFKQQGKNNKIREK